MFRFFVDCKYLTNNRNSDAVSPTPNSPSIHLDVLTHPTQAKPSDLVKMIGPALVQLVNMADRQVGLR